jgi:hypothetical protein
MSDELRLGLMQPYFFPHVAHFALIDHVDRWVVLDVTQYTPQTWMNRNRVLHPSEGFMYATVPVRAGPEKRLIREVVLHDPKAALRSVTAWHRTLGTSLDWSSGRSRSARMTRLWG